MRRLRNFYFLLLVSTLGLSTSALAQPTASDPGSGISVRFVIKAAGTPVRIEHDATTGDLYYLTINGDVYRLPPPYTSQSLAFSSADHGLTGQVLGMLIAPDGTFYLVDNQVTGSLTTGVVRKGVRQLNGSVVWTTVAQTEPYPRSNTPFDHNVNGLALSPDGTYLYLNSGSRTDHGEVQSNNGQFPFLREVPLTSAILRFPANSQNLILPADEASLVSGGYLFADGTRNSFDLAFGPNGDLFGTENAGDRDDNEELNWLREGHHYGFPWQIGMTQTPMQFAGYDHSQDLLLNPQAIAVKGNFFYNDTRYPAPPAGVTFTEPIRNLGPDARYYRDPSDGLVKQVSGNTVFGTFTTHRSPLGLVFDNAGLLPEPYSADGFVLSWTGANDSDLLAPFSGEGEDLLHLSLNKVGDTYETQVNQLVRGFSNPIDAVLVGSELFVLEFSEPKSIWKIRFPQNTAVESELPVEALTLDAYPNPSNGDIRLKIETRDTQEVQVSVYDVLGREVTRVLPTTLLAGAPNELRIDLSGKPSGVYSVEVRGDRGPIGRRLITHYSTQF